MSTLRPSPLGVPAVGLALALSALLTSGATGQTMLETGVLTPSASAAGDGLGLDVVLEGNRAAVASADGHVRVFTLQAGAWNETADLLVAPSSTLVPSVSLDLDGDTLVYSDYLATPAVIVFEFDGVQWGVDASISSPIPSTFFGRSISVSGDRLLVGAARHDGIANDGGAGYVYERTAMGWVEETILLPPAGASDQYGWAVALHGDVAVLGAGQAAAMSYSRSTGSWIEEGLLPGFLSNALDFDGTTLLIGATTIGFNAVGVFRRTQDGWAKITDLSIPGSWTFGADVAVSGDRAAIGRPSGSAHLYERVGETWSPLLEFDNSDAVPSDDFGHRVALDGNRALVTAPGDLLACQACSGKVYEYVVNKWAWTDLGGGTVGSAGAPGLSGTPVIDGFPVTLSLTQAPAGALLLVWLSLSPTPFSALGGTVHAFPFTAQAIVVADASGQVDITATWPAGLPSGTSAWFQMVIEDPPTQHDITLSNGLRTTNP